MLYELKSYDDKLNLTKYISISKLFCLYKTLNYKNKFYPIRISYCLDRRRLSHDLTVGFTVTIDQKKIVTNSKRF